MTDKKRRFSDSCEVEDELLQRSIELLRAYGDRLSINLLKLNLKIGRIKASLILDELEYRDIIQCDDNLTIKKILIK